MGNMTDLVAAIRAAIDETERIAQACWPGVDFHAGEDPTSPGTFDLEAYESGSLGNFVEVGRVRAPFVEHIAHHDPAAVLRRCAADRKILDLHAPTKYLTFHGGATQAVLQCEHCASLCHSGSGLACGSPDAPYPCETVQIVAEAYGVEA